MADLYWLGTSALSWKPGKTRIGQDQKIPEEALKSMGAKRIEHFKQKGLIGDAPRSMIIARAALNTQEVLKAAQVKLAKLEQENDRLKTDNENLSSENDQFKRDRQSLSKTLKANEKLKTEHTELVEENDELKTGVDGFKKLVFEKNKEIKELKIKLEKSEKTSNGFKKQAEHLIDKVKKLEQKIKNG